MKPSFTTQLLIICAFACALSRGEKGSDSQEVSSDEASNEKSSATQKKPKRKTGVQHKFWIPTYPGHNPLNRRKIDITNSEIERFDSSIDESLSGVNRNGTRASKKTSQTEKDLSKLPYLWSGENLSNNFTVKDLASLESSLVISESERSRDDDSTEFQKNYSPFTWSRSNNSDVSKESLDTSEKSSISSSKDSYDAKPKQKTVIKETTKSSKKVSKIPSRKQSTEVKSNYDSQETIKPENFQKKLDVATNENVLTKEYYKQLVKEAVDNTKKKLGYRELSEIIHQTFRPIIPDSLTIESGNSAPEIYKVNMEKKSREKVKSEEEIHFDTKHQQFGSKNTQPDINKFRDEEKEERVKTLAQKLTGKPREHIFWNLTESELNKTYNKQREVDFPSSVYYDAWSDVLLKNRTQRKSRQRKPKTTKLSSSFERSSGDMRTWPGKQIQEKADKMKNKDGKAIAKSKKKIKNKKKEKRQKEQGKGISDEDYNNVYEDSAKVEGKKRKRKKYDFDYNEDSIDYDSRLRGGGKNTDYDYNYNEYSDKKKPRKKSTKKEYDPEKPKRKFRMTTEGERRHAYKEVRSYLNEMDEKHGGRPGGDTYREQRGRSYDKGSNKGRGWDERGSNKGRGWDKRGDDRGRFRSGRREGGRFERRGDVKDNMGYRDRGGDRRKGSWNDRDDRGVWDQRGRSSGRGRGVWGRDDRTKGRDRRGGGRDDRRDTRGFGRGRGGGGGRGRGGGGRGRGGGGRGRS